MRTPSRGWRIAGWSLLVAGSIACALLARSMLWVIVPSAAWVVLVQLGTYQTFRDWRVSRRRSREEPVDEWIVEFGDKDLGLLRDAIFADMFWKTFTVVGADERLFDESYWVQGRFKFRHAVSGRRASSAFCGGLRPTPEAPQVSMRGLS